MSPAIETENHLLRVHGLTSGAGLIPGPAGRCMTSALLHPCATALDQNDQHDHEQHAGNNPDNRGSVHVKSPFLFYLKNALNESAIVMNAGPRTTRKSEGKIKSTSGKTIFTVVLAAISSTF